MADLGQKIGLGGARGVGRVPRGDEAPLGLALAAQVARKRAKLRRLAGPMRASVSANGMEAPSRSRPTT